MAPQILVEPAQEPSREENLVLGESPVVDEHLQDQGDPEQGVRRRDKVRGNDEGGGSDPQIPITLPNQPTPTRSIQIPPPTQPTFGTTSHPPIRRQRVKQLVNCNIILSQLSSSNSDSEQPDIPTELRPRQRR